jgi:arylsulfatase A-like enzyme
MKLAVAATLFLLAKATESAPSGSPKHILVVVADDLGRQDLGARNAHADGPRTITPAIDELISSGVTLSQYHTFKICSPSRASTLTGRYPWGAGFYDMNADNDHTTTNFTLYPKLLQAAGYKTHALGKWDVGFMVRNATATVGRGFDTFFGYYLACNADYWYHTVANGGSECSNGNFNSSIQDWSDNVGDSLGPGDRVGRNGTYNRNLLSGRAASIVAAHDASAPLFMYLAFQNAHEGCARPDKLGMQAPLSSVELYNTTILDTYKLMGAMLTELDYGVKEVVDALKAANMYQDTLIWFVSDNVSAPFSFQPPLFPPSPPTASAPLPHPPPPMHTHSPTHKKPYPPGRPPGARHQCAPSGGEAHFLGWRREGGGLCQRGRASSLPGGDHLAWPCARIRHLPHSSGGLRGHHGGPRQHVQR